jgi:hypothetical protein
MPFDRWNLLIEVYNDIIAERNELQGGNDE